MNVQAALKWAKDRLKEAKSDRPDEAGNYALDAQIILEHTLKKPRGFALVHPEAEITPEAERSFLYDIERRASGVCTAYITGHKLFRSLDLFVNEAVLVPRPDTETLIEAALELIDGWQGGAPAPLKKPLKILDLGTGSGAIALSLWRERPGLEVDASDISESALEVARRNCALCVGSGGWGTGNGEQGTGNGECLVRRELGVGAEEAGQGEGGGFGGEAPSVNNAKCRVAENIMRQAGTGSRQIKPGDFKGAEAPLGEGAAENAAVGGVCSEGETSPLNSDKRQAIIDNRILANQNPKPLAQPPLSPKTAFPTPHSPLPTPNFIQSELFQNIGDSYDIIVSNPPYIPSKMIAGLAPEVRDEPRLALDGGEDGLVLIRRIIKEAPSHLKPGGRLLLEVSPNLMPQISKLLREGGFTDISIKKDLNGDDRVIASEILRLTPPRRQA